MRTVRYFSLLQHSENNYAIWIKYIFSGGEELNFQITHTTLHLKQLQENLTHVRYLTKSHFCSAIKLFSLCDIAIIDLIYTWKRWTILTTTGCNSFSSPAKLLSIGLRAGRSVCVIESNCSSDVGSWIEMNHIHHTIGKQLFDVGLFRKHWWQLVIIVIICLCFYTIPLLH